MKKIALLTTAALFAGIASATIIFQDDFSSYTGGTVWGADWRPKWDGGDTSQQNLFTSDGTYGKIDLTAAKRNYHAPSQHGFSITGTDTATISADLRYVHAGGAPSAVNKNNLALGFSTGSDWWAGTWKYGGLGNRGNALGSPIGQAPWVEGWMDHTSVFGIDDSGSGGTGLWFQATANLSVSGGTYWLQLQVHNAAGDVLLMDGTNIDTGIAEGTTIYGGLTTGWNDVGNTNIASFAKIDEFHVDNFTVETIPEPATLGLVAFFAGAVLFIRRRFMM